MSTSFFWKRSDYDDDAHEIVAEHLTQGALYMIQLWRHNSKYFFRCKNLPGSKETDLIG